jgi:DNA-binding GntR family transcriptional regulator
VGYRASVDFELPPQVRLPTASAAEQVVAAMRRLIIEGAIPPGARLRETQLAGGFDVSRQTVREAIRHLAHDGLVRHDRHRGAVVVDLDGDDIADIYAVRRVLETAGVDRLTEADAASVAVVERAFEHLAGVATDGGWAAVVDADIAFHRSLVALSGSPRLARAFDAITGELAFCLSVLRLVGDEERTPATIISEHAPIAGAVSDGDAARARALVRGHVDDNAHKLARTLADRQAAILDD